MRRVRLHASLIGGALLLLPACRSPDAVEEPLAIMEATINGTSWQAEYVFGDYDTATGLLWVTGSRQNATGDTVRAIDLGGLPITGPATVQLGGSPPWGEVRDNVDYSSPVRYWLTTDSINGAATVTEFDLATRRCSGTFSFAALLAGVRDGQVTPDTIRVTSGSWTVKFVIVP